MAYQVPLMIPGAKATLESIEVRTPFDNQRLATVACSDQTAVEQALSNAASLFKDYDNRLPLRSRIDILANTATLMSEQSEELALLAAKEGGKPLIDSRTEVTRAVDGINICIETLRTSAGQVIPMGVNAASAGRIAFTQKEPMGVVVAVSAFNHPLNLIVHQVGPAIATGCPVIVKPSENTPLSCFRFIEILRKAGLPDRWCQPLVVKDVSLAETLVTDPRVGFFSFIGSAKVGWMLRSKLAPGTRCALEHGGAAPVIVSADADLEDTLPLLAKAGFYHAGQVCVSVQRVFAHHSIARDVAQGLARFGTAMQVGDPTDENTDVGPLIQLRELQRVQNWVTEAVDSGAECLCGNEVILQTCLAPTVLFNPPFAAKVSNNEIFGPVICVYPFDDMQEAINQANSLPYAFQASVFSKDIDTAMSVSSRLAASAVMINDHTAFRVDWMPFAGLKQSGLGVGGIPHTMADMQVEKLITLRSKGFLY